MRILVTGACGFAGAVLARRMIESAADVQIIGIDNLSRPGSQTNVEPLRALGVEVRIGDILDRDFLASLPRCQWILDCAANPSVLAGVDGSSSLGVVEQNLFGTVNLLELCKHWNAGFTLLSTSRVYSIPPLATLPLEESSSRFYPAAVAKLPPGLSSAGVAEDFSTSAPISLYGSTKLCSEALALEYGETFGFPVWINRCGVLAGAGQFGKADQGIFSYWIHSWNAGKPLRYIGFGGRGKQVRDCLHPRDLADLILRQIHGPVPDNAPRIVNFAGGIANSMSLRELTDWCAHRLGESASKAFIDASAADEIRPFDIPWMVLNAAQARKVWQWEPRTTLPDVLEEIAIHALKNPHWLDLVSAPAPR